MNLVLGAALDDLACSAASTCILSARARLEGGVTFVVSLVPFSSAAIDFTASSPRMDGTDGEVPRSPTNDQSESTEG